MRYGMPVNNEGSKQRAYIISNFWVSLLSKWQIPIEVSREVGKFVCATGSGQKHSVKRQSLLLCQWLWQTEINCDWSVQNLTISHGHLLWSCQKTDVGKFSRYIFFTVQIHWDHWPHWIPQWHTCVQPTCLGWSFTKWMLYQNMVSIQYLIYWWAS